MRRKIQRQPKRYIPERIVREQASPSGLHIQEALTILGGLTGLVVAILWVAGRFYMAGYFDAMNIPSSQINLSVWEYAEASWLRLIFFFLKRTYPFLLLVATVPLAILVSTFILQRIFPRRKFVAAIRNMVAQLEGLQTGIIYLLLFSLAIYFAYLLILTLLDIRASGQQEGKDIVFSDTYAIEVYSKDQLPLGRPTVFSSRSPALFEYSGLRLLTFNNGKYYLFREIDPDTCKPSQVFIVPDSQEILIVLRDGDTMDTNWDTKCSATPAASPAPD